MATNKNITMKQFNGVDYDTLYPKTKVEQVEGAYAQQQILSDSTKGLYGLGANAVPDDVFGVLSRFQKGVGNEYVWAKSDGTGIIGYVNSPDHNAYPPSVSDGYTYTALGQIGAKANITTGKYTGTGKYGNTNLNSLTFSFFPKAIFIIPVATSMSSYSGQFGAFLYGTAMCSTRFDGGNGSTQCNVTITGWDTNTIKWFGASSSYQLNDSKKEYRYVAIG